MRGKIVLALFVLTILGIFAAVRYRHSLDVELAREKRGGTGPVPPDTSALHTIQKAVRPTATEGAAAPTLVAPKDPEFQQWIRAEARSIDDLNVDGEKKQAQIRERVKKIGPAQAEQLRLTLSQPGAAAREKILSAFLLVEGGGLTREELKKAIVAPLDEKGGEPHSMDEVNGVREKSLRIMMIDGLFAQAQHDPQARETLARAIVDSADPYIRSYAQEKYDQLSKQ